MVFLEAPLLTGTYPLRLQPPPERKDTTKKKVAAKKKNVATGVWPCKINGCNKQFAREADLKRHQRTTKLHSMPGLYVLALLKSRLY